jgi:hypothetical protein
LHWHQIISLFQTVDFKLHLLGSFCEPC